MPKLKTYKVYVSDCYYIYNKEDGVYNWATDEDKTVPEFTQKLVESHKTVREAMNSIENWGSEWVMYPSVIIEDDEGSEVYSSIPVLDKCKCCNREEWDRIESDLRTMKRKDGSLLFPDIE